MIRWLIGILFLAMTLLTDYFDGEKATIQWGVLFICAQVWFASVGKD